MCVCVCVCVCVYYYHGSPYTLFSFPHRAADTYIKSGPGRIGSKYAKVLFRGFTDETFRTQIPHPPLLGHIGPVIRAEVGDTIMVYLKNLALTSGRNFSIHPHGVLYDKRSEGKTNTKVVTEQPLYIIANNGESCVTLLHIPHWLRVTHRLHWLRVTSVP